MNLSPPVIAVLGALVLAWAVESLAKFLTLRSLGKPLPQPVRHLFDADDPKRSHSYVRAATGLEFFRQTAGLAAVCLFALCGGYGWLSRMVHGSGLPAIPAGLLAIGLLVLARGALDLPFSLYATFGLEARYGFNTTSWRTYLADRLKGTLLGVFIGGSLLAAALFAFERLGGKAWLAVWGAGTIVSFAVLVALPPLILPLFNRFSPLPEGGLKDGISAYAASQGFQLSGIFVMDGSKRSTKANAFLTGIGRKKRISLYDTLLKSLADHQIMAVVAHEMGHARLGHVPKGLALSVVQLGVLAAVLQMFLSVTGIQEAFGAKQPSTWMGLALFGLASQPLMLALGVVSCAFARRFEREADRFAAQGPAGPVALAQALTDLTSRNLSQINPHPLSVWLHHSHPPVTERILALNAMADAQTGP